MSTNKIVIGDKEYSKTELLEFGKQHYPKFYWIYRGVGIGLMLIGVLSALIFVLTMIISEAEMNDISNSFNSDTSYHSSPLFYAATIPFGVIAIIGAVLFAISFKKKPDEAYIKHAVDYYTKLYANNKIRESRKEEKERNKDISQLLKYKELLDAGIISQEEFDKKKEEFLNNN